MSNGVEFDVDKVEYSSRRSSPRVNIPSNFDGNFGSNSAEPKMSRWLMGKGLVKSPQSAQKILIAVVIINIIITFIIVKYFI